MTTNLDDRAWRRLRQRIARQTATLRIGVFSGPHPSGLDVSELAAIHEFGTARVPARSFIRSTLSQRRDEIAALMTEAGRRVVAGTPSTLALVSVGRAVSGMIRDKILKTNIPPSLAPATVARKGHAHALVDTYTLARSVSWKIVQ